MHHDATVRGVTLDPRDRFEGLGDYVGLERPGGPGFHVGGVLAAERDEQKPVLVDARTVPSAT